MYEFIKKQDAEIFAALEGEETREREGLELIPSENYVSKAVREAQGSILTNKYAEGYPGKRYYGGQQFTDAAESLAIERAKQLFGAKFANVQTHSGANANIAMYMALLQPGDTVLGMDLSHGGHLTHGHPVTYITKFFNFVRYKMKNVETGEIDYDEMRRVAIETKPKIDSRISSKAVSTVGLTFLAFAFVMDLVIVERRKIPRIVGHNLDHIMLIIGFLLFIILQKGSS